MVGHEYTKAQLNSRGNHRTAADSPSHFPVHDHNISMEPRTIRISNFSSKFQLISLMSMDENLDTKLFIGQGDSHE
uniref:Uncharacterized protein n=1 Tax=Rhizophora mucronata TaxID=61149 RepID=A0A2P2NZ51_RHIMU